MATDLAALDDAIVLLRGGRPVVVGSRRHGRSVVEGYALPIRRLGAITFNRIVRDLAGGISDTQCDPRTGIPVKQRKNIRGTVRSPDGKGKMIVAQADLVTLDKDEKAMVDTANSKALQIAMVRSYIPAPPSSWA